MPADDGRFVADGDDGGETDTEPPDGGLVPLALGGGAQGAERFDTGRVEGRAGVGGHEHGGTLGRGGPQGEPEPAGGAGAGGGVGGVLRQLDDQAVTVAAEREVLLGVGVLPETGGTRPQEASTARRSRPVPNGSTPSVVVTLTL